jgi:hypothetical protein
MILNLNLINSIFPSINLKEEDKNKLIEKIKNIQNLFEQKKTLITNKKNINGEILINRQILEENKRIKTENLSSYKEQYDELLSNVIRKELRLKKYHKKFLEVEQYARREFGKYGIKNFYKKINVIAYVIQNENLILRKNSLISDIKMLFSNLNTEVKENYHLKSNGNIQLTNANLNQRKSINKLNNQYDSIIKLYSNKILLLQNSIYKLKKIKERLKSNKRNLDNNNKEDENSEIEIIGDKTINVSILSNVKPDLKNYLTTNVSIMSKASNLAWDLSCIEKDIE